MLSEGLDEFVPVGLHVAAKWAAQSQFSGEETLRQSIEATARTCKINVTEVLLMLLPPTLFDPYLKEAFVIWQDWDCEIVEVSPSFVA